MLALCPELVAQGIHPDLKANAAVYDVRMKAGSPMGKWEFGPYRMIKGKYKWSDEAAQSDLFKDKLKQKRVKRSHFIMEHKDGRQVIVNIGAFDELIATDWATTRDFEVNSDGWFAFGHTVHKVDVYSLSLMASIMTLPEYTEWRLVLLNYASTYDLNKMDSHHDNSKWRFKSSKTDVSNVYIPPTDFLGVLTNGAVELHVKPSLTIEDGGGLIPSFRLTTEYYLGDQPVAALDIYGIKITDRKVYIKGGLDPEVELAIAGAIMMSL